MRMKLHSRTSQGVRPPMLRRRRRKLQPALGYASVPEGVDLDAPQLEQQALDIRHACRDLGLDLRDVVREREEANDGGARRAGLEDTLERLDAGEASCLVVDGLERLSRRVADLARVVDHLERRGVRLIILDVGLDTATPSGRLAVAPPPSPPAAEPAVEAQPSPAPSGQAAAERVEAPPTAPASQPAAEPDEAEQPPVPTGQPGAAEPVEAPPPAPTSEVAVEPVPAPAPKSEEPALPPRDSTAAAVQPSGPPDLARRAVGPATSRALGYASVPSDGEAGGTELDVQRKAIAGTCRRLGLELVEVVREREPRHGNALDRACLSHAIGRIAVGDASCLVVVGLERLSRSVSELGTLVQWFERNGVRLIAVDLGLDTATPGGHTTARTLASVAHWEHERLSERTRKGLAAARSKRREAAGAANVDWAALRKRIAAMRADGMTLQAIADVLNKEGVPTQRGGRKWRPSSVQTAAGYRRRSGSRSVEDLPPVDRPAPRGRGGGGPEKRREPRPGRSDSERP